MWLTYVNNICIYDTLAAIFIVGGPDIIGACVTDGVGSAVVVTSTGVGRAVVAVTEEGGNVDMTAAGGRPIIGVLSGTTATKKIRCYCLLKKVQKKRVIVYML